MFLLKKLHISNVQLFLSAHFGSLSVNMAFLTVRLFSTRY